MNKESAGSETKEQPQGQKLNIEFHLPPDLEYTYRDISNVFVGPGEVVLEFGNIHRSMPGHGTISNRIVLSVRNAYELRGALSRALNEAEQKLQNSLKAQ